MSWFCWEKKMGKYIFVCSSENLNVVFLLFYNTRLSELVYYKGRNLFKSCCDIIDIQPFSLLLYLWMITFSRKENDRYYLTHCMLGEIFSRRYSEFFFLFSQKLGFSISCKLSPMTQSAWNVKGYILWKIRKTIINLSSAESAQKVVKVTFHNVLEKVYQIILRKWHVISPSVDGKHCNRKEFLLQQTSFWNSFLIFPRK